MLVNQIRIMDECASFFNLSLVLVSYRIEIKTGDAIGAGTNANVGIILHGQGNTTEEFRLNKPWRHGFARGKTDGFCVMSEVNLLEVTSIELWRDSDGVFSNWYVDYVEVTNLVTDITSIFPVMTWINADEWYKVDHTDTCLPQNDPFKDMRALELLSKQETYQLTVHVPGGPAQVKVLPEDEKFSFHYQFNIAKLQQTYAAESQRLLLQYGVNWNSIDDVETCYTDVFGVPKGAAHFNDDEYFGRQRLAGVNPNVIRLCTEIPDNFGVTEDMIRPLLEGKTIQHAIDQRKLFIINYAILDGVPTKSAELAVPAPIALFYFNNKKRLVPIAIQLYQQKGPENPVFLPTDPEYTWMMAKMWFNLADATYHQALSHLTLTHFVMEGIAVVSKRQLSPSHPLLRLLNPHFLYLMPINAEILETTNENDQKSWYAAWASFGLVTLVNQDGIFDQTSNGGRNAVFYLMTKSLKEWRLDVQGTLPEDLKQRGVYDKSVLRGAYYVRDDALMIYDVIKNYVSKYVRHYYDETGSLEKDYELQAWGAEIVKSRDDGGAGILGVPNNGVFRTADQLITTLTAVIYTCSVGHAAVNFQQYDEYASPFNYPYTLYGQPPKTKAELTRDDVMKSITNRLGLLRLMSTVSILSEKTTQSLGDFEVEYIVDPPAVEILDEFKDQLRAAERIIDRRNAKREFPYDYLHPKVIPNAISI